MAREYQGYLRQLFHQPNLLLSKTESFRLLVSVRLYPNPIKGVLAAFPALICFESTCSFYFHNFSWPWGPQFNPVLFEEWGGVFFYFLNNLLHNFNGCILLFIVPEMENSCFSQCSRRHKSWLVRSYFKCCNLSSVWMGLMDGFKVNPALGALSPCQGPATSLQRQLNLLKTFAWRRCITKWYPDEII